MKHIFYIILVILISACGQSENKSKYITQDNSESTENLGTFSITMIDKDYFDKTKKENKPLLKIDTISIKKLNGEIRIKNKSRNDSVLIFRDKINPNNEESNITYNFLGYFEQIDKYLIETDYYESVDYDLVSKDGSKTNIWNIPTFSNDRKYFACIKSYRLEGEPIGLQIWKISNDLTNSTDTIQFEKIFELNQLIFNPVECIWGNNGALLLKVEKMENNFYPKEPSEKYYFKINYK